MDKDFSYLVPTTKDPVPRYFIINDEQYATRLSEIFAECPPELLINTIDAMRAVIAAARKTIALVECKLQERQTEWFRCAYCCKICAAGELYTGLPASGASDDTALCVACHKIVNSELYATCHIGGITVIIQVSIPFTKADLIRNIIRVTPDIGEYPQFTKLEFNGADLLRQDASFALTVLHNNVGNCGTAVADVKTN